jgi:hypothetical protein
VCALEEETNQKTEWSQNFLHERERRRRNLKSSSRRDVAVRGEGEGEGKRERAKGGGGPSYTEAESAAMTSLVLKKIDDVSRTNFCKEKK